MKTAAEPSARAELLAAEAAYCFLAVLCAAAFGMRMEIPYYFYQIADPAWLSDRLGESLYYMHMQPPLLNAALGAILKLARAAGIRPEPPALAFQFAMGAASIAFWAALCRRMISRPWVRRAALALFVVNPVLYMMLFVYFYPLHELLYLLAFARAGARFTETGRTADFGWAALSLALLILTRALFHFAWGLAVLGVLWSLGPQAPGVPARRFARAAVFAAFAAVLLAWPAKNLAVFGKFTYSTWLGYNIASGLPLATRPLPSTEPIPEKFARIPILAERAEASGIPNWNYYPFIPEFEAVGKEAFALMRDLPRAVAWKALLNYWNFLRFAGRDPYSGNYGFLRDSTAPPRAWLQAYETGVLLDGRSARKLYNQAFESKEGTFTELAVIVLAGPVVVYALRRRFFALLPSGGKKTWASLALLAAATYALALLLYRQSPYTQHFSLFAPPWKPLSVLWGTAHDLWPWSISGLLLLFPVVIFASLRRILRDWRSDPLRARIALMLLAAILWVLLMVLGVDGFEGNRMRFSTEPHWFLLLFWLLEPAPSEAAA